MMLRHIISIAFVLVLGTMFMMYPMIGYAEMRGYEILDAKDAHTTRYEAEKIAVECFIQHNGDVTLQPLYSGEELVYGHWILFSHYIRVQKQGGDRIPVWFVSILDCRDMKSAGWYHVLKASVAINDTTSSIDFYGGSFWYSKEYTDYLSDENDYFSTEKVMFLLFPSNTFRIAVEPSGSDISEGEAISIACQAIADIDDVLIDDKNWKIDAFLSRMEAICDENIWHVNVYENDYPGDPTYICEIYAIHGAPWYLGKIILNETINSHAMYDYIYVDNEYCNDSVDMKIIPKNEFIWCGYDTILGISAD